jgi:predicted amidohydrolase
MMFLRDDGRIKAVRRKVFIPKFETSESSGAFPGLAIRRH